MPWYIRFGKVPEIAPQPSTIGKKSSSIRPNELHFSFEIRNDLGESLYPGSLNVSIEVEQEKKSLNSITSSSSWDGQKWIQNVKLSLPSSFSNAPNRMRVHLRLEADDDHNKLTVEGCDDLHHIYGTTSSWLETRKGCKAEPFALRRLPGGLEVWEGTGSSIAAHVWDAGVILCAHLCYLARTRKHDLHELAGILPCKHGQGATLKRKFRALELGSGCGISGLNLLQNFADSSAELTDTGDAQKLLQRNAAHAVAQGLDKSSTACYTLDWESQQDCTMAAEKVPDRDVVLISDCTYNVDMIEHLVSALQSVVNSAKTLVVVALKRRHEDEEKFFHEMKSWGFVHLRKHVFKVPSNQDEEMYGLEPKDIELHLFRRKQADR